MGVFNFRGKFYNFVQSNLVANYILGFTREVNYFCKAKYNRKKSKKIFIVYGLGRTGSSAFCEFLAQKHNAVNLNELFQYRYLSLKALIINATNITHQPIIIKVLAHQVNTNRITLNVFKAISKLTSCDVEYINLKRNSFHQTLSVAFSRQTQIWHKKKKLKKLKKIAIEKEMYRNILKSIKYNLQTENLMLKAVSSKEDRNELHYEDLQGDLITANVLYEKLSSSGVYDRVINLDELKVIHDEILK